VEDEFVDSDDVFSKVVNETNLGKIVGCAAIRGDILGTATSFLSTKADFFEESVAEESSDSVIEMEDTAWI